MTYLAGSALARLLACSRMTANEHMRAGHFGPPLQHGRIRYAALAGVEQHAGRQFSPEQIAVAVDGRPDRILTIGIEEAA
jgi:hypothetical protein